MSETLEKAAAELNSKAAGSDFSDSAKFNITGLGSIVLDGAGARVSDEDTDVTLTADQETFEAMMTGDLNPTGAFMSGKLSVDGDMSVAMKLASVLS
ncbi:SCP2 sterol-binding domain-containing protein [Lutimaribacter marinistellae]|uniref:SCP2 sterol-binding domain-containing protein n=1 Tax=Lutimaribacter marinistellae TaxID=1820329 RepID=A0ABV7TNV4_9RHOB